MVRLRVLDEVTWDGSPVPGERTHALLRGLVRAGRRGAGEHALIEEIWAGDDPANPTKALQVVVSRARAATSAAVIERTPTGYRLALGPEDVDAWAARPVGLRLAAEGRYADALPLLEEAPADEAVTCALIRATAAVHGVPAALERFEAVRSDLADRLGVDPPPALQELHRELLASDRPVRSGVHHYASSLIGRGEDLGALRSLLRSHRVVSILGPGGLGKTRLAQLVAADAEQPIVHVVELVSVVDPDDLVGEVGSALGVRDSVSGRRVLTAVERRDVRTRIAQTLDQAPTLLVLDNCEHLIEAVADLVAFLVTAAPRLRVLTTTRTPLAIAAEQVFPLRTLSTADAAELFRQRANAARPGVALPAEHVASIVGRLDGLPLAIELAAVKVRAMSVADVDARLEDRFALLRGGDRSAPGRHQTLLAVIDWSWNLLAAREQRALSRLSVFHDGFDLEGAEAMVGDEALAAVESLVDNSLLTVIEDGGVRYRMLETVREFGRLQLGRAGEEADAAAAHRVWAVELCRRIGPSLFGPDQVRSVDALRVEDGNLTDVLRQALADGDPASVVAIFSALSGYWSIIGDHQRAISLAGAVSDAIVEWTPPDELLDMTRMTVAMCLFGAQMALPGDAGRLRDAALRLGTDAASPQLSALLKILITIADPTGAEVRTVLARLTGDPDPRVRATAYQFLSHERENFADPQQAIAAAQESLALLEDDIGPWHAATLHSQLCGLYAQVGDISRAALHASQALPGLIQLGALDDVLQVKVILAMAALEHGESAKAERLAAEIEQMHVQGPFGSRGAVLALRGQLLLAQGRTAEGLAAYRSAVAVMRETTFPARAGEAPLRPWVVISESIALAAYVRHGSGDDGHDLYETLTAKAAPSLDEARPLLDLPVNGALLFSCGLWGLLRGALAPEDAVRLLVVADRFAYSRSAPTMRWADARQDAERMAPGVLAAVEGEYADRRGTDLLDEARALVTKLWSDHILRE